MNLTPANLVAAIDKLPKNVFYDYCEKKTKTKVRIVKVNLPVGGITIERKQIKKGSSTPQIEEESISASMIRRYANAFAEGVPVNVERVLGSSYNTRSALEALLAHTPEFHLARPKRIEMLDSSTELKRGHKHLIWDPNRLHPQGEIHEIPCELTISERPSIETVYGIVEIPPDVKFDMEIAVKRRHTQIQIALAHIGAQLGFRTHIAANDQTIEYNGKPLLALPNVTPDLKSETLLTAWSEAVDAARFIDCVWFKNGKLMPAVMEIEHSTGVTSGLVRMQKFKNALPDLRSRWVVVAPDEDRDDVIRKCNDPQFKGLDTKFFPYSAVEELHALCQRRKLKGVSEEFLDCFMENTLG
jgi:type II restriction enzyme